jgi:hypothetical protein
MINMTLVPLGDGGLLVYSPTWLGRDTFEQVEAIGTPRVLLAPNHYHHMSLTRFRERYPDAVAVASKQAMPRLERKGHVGVAHVGSVSLPDGVRFIECPHTRAGEVWVSHPSAEGRGWIVGDAFFHVNERIAGVLGAVLRLTHTTPGLCIGQTFRWIGLSDESRYRHWLLERLDDERPRAMQFSHGTPIEDDDLYTRLRALSERRLRGG